MTLNKKYGVQANPSVRHVLARMLVVAAIPFALTLASESRGAEPNNSEPLVVAPSGPAFSPPGESALALNGSAEMALKVLAPLVLNTSNATALSTTFRAYFNYRAAHPGRVLKPYLYFVDLGLDNGSARGYVFDMDRLEVVDGPFTVAHGRGSSAARNTVPANFSNMPGSNASSLGLYLAGATYDFSGKSGGRPYKSTGLRLHGESGSFNDAALSRGIVAHGAPYVTALSAGRSEGCPAMEPQRAERLLPMLANGGVVFLYSPNDARWLSEEPWVSGGSRPSQ